MIEFVCVGFDIRVWPTENYFSADATVWPQAEHLYDRAKSELGLEENRFQLLQTEEQKDIERLQNLVEQVPGAILVAFEIPLAVFNACQQIGQYESSIQLGKCRWKEFGFDVCDINGFFSILHMDILTNTRIDLFSRDELTDALVLSQAANILVPTHRPFVVVGLKIVE